MSMIARNETLRVRDGGQTIEILGPDGVTTPPPDMLDYYRARTVEGMFADTNTLLARQRENDARAVLSKIGGLFPWLQGAYTQPYLQTPHRTWLNAAQYDPNLG
jgi:hypothetical protein